jgi:hypothetical protein
MRFSGALFLSQVWPVIREHCGGGRVVAVERPDGRASPGFALLDLEAGIDYIQIDPDGVPFGLAVRVQECRGQSFDTFTVRRRTRHGRPTELAKRLAALDKLHLKPLFSRWTIQAYVTASDRRSLVAVGVVPTVALLTHVKAGHEDEHWWLDQTTDAEFLYVPWTVLPSYWAPFVWRAP